MCTSSVKRRFKEDLAFMSQSATKAMVVMWPHGSSDRFDYTTQSIFEKPSHGISKMYASVSHELFLKCELLSYVEQWITSEYKQIVLDLGFVILKLILPKHVGIF